MSRTYFLFAGNDYYPAGGMQDFRGAFGSPDIPREAIRHFDWAHVAVVGPNGALLTIRVLLGTFIGEVAAPEIERRERPRRPLDDIERTLIVHILERTGCLLERFLMGREEILAAERLVRRGLLRKGVADTGGRGSAAYWATESAPAAVGREDLAWRLPA